MNIIDPSTSKRQINFLSGSETKSSSSENQNSEDDQINRIKYQKIRQQGRRHCYSGPTPPHLLYEEKPQRNTYNDTFIYDWNIDGLSEHEIINVLHQMIMASTAYLTDNNDHNAAQLIISGFFETLRSWWDNGLNKDER